MKRKELEIIIKMIMDANSVEEKTDILISFTNRVIEMYEYRNNIEKTV